MRVLVTGGSGFLGRHVVRSILARGHSVVVLVRPSRASAVRIEGAEVAAGDLRLPRTLAAALEGVDAVVHLAACVVGDEETQFHNTVVGTENLLAAMAAAGVYRLVHCSSFSVYDWRAARRSLDETTPLESDRLYQRDGYAIAKTWQERVVRRWAEANDARLTVLRPGFIWGAGKERLACIGQELGPLDVIFGPLRETPITYVENCADAFALALDRDDAVGATLNVIDDERVSAWRYAAELRRRLGIKKLGVPAPYAAVMAMGLAATLVSRSLFPSGGKLPGVLMPLRSRARFAPHRFPNDRLKETLGWAPRWGFAEAWDRCVAKDAENNVDVASVEAPVAERKAPAERTPSERSAPAIARRSAELSEAAHA
ncbi:3 beta-hydroxysteroid dehydrogenase/Delta 5--_4-isomerase [Pseudobythopirellula maris]|uniref:3 beta-hydroxysteroid dehydrogenase/Delta 5-->4-isomerase n=1 Tax=Pseudobythopirellula maris TaxID=2527991 RepID=A0A5C5ZK67_9BACT|nr:NAD(P)-dependent oxidoreductase [Pseudobythopirellula maris]TWT87528.1 3 beta-hydroxysteroid dehydrogenase/Delta 5-->4-isomerase [Pseudobythopirellula maris]